MKKSIAKFRKVKKNEGMISALKKAILPFLITTPEIRIIQRNVITKQKILKENKQLLSTTNSDISFDEKNDSNIIWFMWLQGITDAPVLVKMCYLRLKMLYPEKDIIVITEKNFRKYVTIPQYILQKWKSQYITNTHFSDILRVALLVQYGGTWIDSTVWCSSKVREDFFFHTSLFFFSSALRNDNSVSGSSWFISSSPNNPVLSLTQALLYEYWKKNNKLSNYFLFHICFSISLNHFPKIKASIPVISNVPAHFLAEHLDETYDEQEMKFLLKQAYFHKLSNKIELTNSNNTLFYHLSKVAGLVHDND